MSQEQHKLTLMAFADDELDVEQTIRLLGEKGLCDEDKLRIDEAKRLRKACCSCLSKHSATKAPAELADCIRKMLEEDQPAPAFQNTNSPSDSPVIARFTQWIPSGVAALFLLSALAVWTNILMDDRAATGSFASVPGRATTSTTSTASLTPIGFDAFGNRHTDCSRNTQLMHHTLTNPQDIQALPGALHDYFDNSFDQSLPMDLSVLGYQYIKAAKCTLPTEGAIHVLYKPDPGAADGAPNDAALSLWISDKPGLAASPLESGTLYSAQTRNGQPVFIWRQNGLTYFLVGDDQAAVRKAANVLSPCAPKAKPVE